MADVMRDGGSRPTLRQMPRRLQLTGCLVVFAAVVVTAGAANSGISPCLPSQLRAVAGLQGATGSELGGISLLNRGSAACVLPRTAPQVSFIWRGRRLAVQQVSFPPRWLDSQYGP